MRFYWNTFVCWWKGHDWRQVIRAAEEPRWTKRWCWRCGYFEYQRKPTYFRRVVPWQGETLEEALENIRRYEAAHTGEIEVRD